MHKNSYRAHFTKQRRHQTEDKQHGPRPAHSQPVRHEHVRSHQHVRQDHVRHEPHAPKQAEPVKFDPIWNEGVFAELSPQLQKAISEEGYATPTPIQAKTIPHLMAGRDVLGCAQTGTGKTAAFTLPILHYLEKNKRPLVRGTPRVLILAPTRELAAQIGESVATYGKHLRMRHTVIFGGVGQYPQVKAVEHGVDILVATPGRLLDLMNQRHVRLSGVEVFVLDEADRMLDMGFINDIRKIIAALPAKRQSLFFSATLTKESMGLARTMVRDAVHITITPDQPTVEKIVQKVMFVDRENKDALLVKLLSDPKIDKVLVFVGMKHLANKVVVKLRANGIASSAIHSKKSQTDRMRALSGFKAGKVRVLVATDIAARGIDVDRITHVINYNMPNEIESYVHRIGRTARAGAEGDAISFCSADERNFLRDIERLIRKQIPVDTDHPYHSDTARNATGAAARPLPRRGDRAPRPNKTHNTQRARGPRRNDHRSPKH